MKFFLIVLLSSCAIHQSYIPVTKSLPPREKGCAVEIYQPEVAVTKSYRVLGMLTLEEPDFEAKCNWDKAMDKFKAEACKVGADAIQIVKLDEPQMKSTCYRMMANFISYQ